VPGLIDMHVHITSSPLYSGYNSLLFTDSFWSVIGVAHAKSTLEAGFTTIRNVGSEGYADVGLKQAIDAADALGQTGQVGQIKAGAWGDLVGVRGDPLSDVRVLETPVFVMKGGQTVRKP